MRTTISLNDELLASAKRRARERGTTLGQVIESALRRELTAGPATLAPPAIPIFSRGTGPRPGLDLTSNQALHEILDEASELDHRR